VHFKYKGQTRNWNACDYNNFISRYQTAIEANMLQKLFPEKIDPVIDADCGTDRFIELLIAGSSSKQMNVSKQ
jgi:hypothetical protein